MEFMPHVSDIFINLQCSDIFLIRNIPRFRVTSGSGSQATLARRRRFQDREVTNPHLQRFHHLSARLSLNIFREINSNKFTHYSTAPAYSIHARKILWSLETIIPSYMSASVCSLSRTPLYK